MPSGFDPPGGFTDPTPSADTSPEVDTINDSAGTGIEISIATSGSNAEIREIAETATTNSRPYRTVTVDGVTCFREWFRSGVTAISPNGTVVAWSYAPGAKKFMTVSIKYVAVQQDGTGAYEAYHMNKVFTTAANGTVSEINIGANYYDGQSGDNIDGTLGASGTEIRFSLDPYAFKTYKVSFWITVLEQADLSV